MAIINNFRVGDVVKHNFSQEEQGTVTEVREDPIYMVFVKWNNNPQYNDWYDPSVLVGYRTSRAANALPPPAGTDGAIGIALTLESLHNSPNVEKDTQFPFTK